MSLTIYTHPDCELHAMPRHPECPERLRSVMQRLEESGITGSAKLVLANEVEERHILAIHDQPLLDTINASEPVDKIIKVDPDTYMSPGSLRAAKLAAGACAAATDAVLSGKTNRAFCAIRPPGHHAEIKASMGFCLFNNIAIAAEHALQQPGIAKVAIVDFDVHHCNGTVDIFKDRPEVLVCSSFQNHFYPHRYLDFSNDHIVNTPLAAGAGGDQFKLAVEQSWLPALEAHAPDLLLVSAGFDAHVNDPVGQLQFTESDYQWVTQQLIAVANQHCQGKLVSTLEGGYDLTALASCVETHVGTLLSASK